MTRGLAEMARLGAAFGADPRTFAGLAGLGDLVGDVLLRALAATGGRACCWPAACRRRGLEARIGMVAEGLVTAPTLLRIGRERALDLPLTERVCAALDGEPTAEAVELLLAREAGDEF